MKRFLLIFSLLFAFCLTAQSQTTYNAIATAYVTTTISQSVVFDSNMQQGGTFTFSVLAHNGGGRAGQSDTANVKIEFYTAGGALVTSANSTYSANLPNPNAVCGNPCIDTSVPWSTLTISKTLTSTEAANVAYARVSMYGIDGSYWAGDYGPWYRAPTFQHNGGGNLAYNPEFGPYNNIAAQGWSISPGLGACQGAWGGSNPCIANSDGVAGTSTVGLVANQNGGGPSATGGTTSGTAGGYNNTMTVTNAGTGATSGAAPAAPTVTSTTVTYTTSNVTTSPGVISTYRTPVTTKTWSDGTTTTENGTPVLTNTAVASTVVTNRVNGSTLTTYSTPILTNTPADGSAPYISANGQQSITTQQVQQGLRMSAWEYDSKSYSCGFLGCIWDLGRVTPSTNRGSYGTPNYSAITSNGMFISTNGNMPNGRTGLFYADNTVINYAGTITIPITATNPAGSIYRVYFYNQSDDGLVMRINGTTVIDNQTTFQLQAILGSYNSSGWIDLVAGQTYNFDTWYWNVTGGYGLRVFWNIGGGIVQIPNSAFTTGSIANVTIDTSGLAYTNDAIVPVSGLCCGGTSTPFNADADHVAKIGSFMDRTTNDSKVFIEQIGSNNTITVNQSGTPNNYTGYYGYGYNNEVTVNQTGNSSTLANYTDIRVVGDSNKVAVTQQSTGGGKGAFVTVNDNNNKITIQQKDSGSHYASVSVSGGNKEVDILQQGSASHMANVTLTGPQPASIGITQSGATQQSYSINFNCATAGGCAKITVNQGP